MPNKFKIHYHFEKKESCQGRCVTILSRASLHRCGRTTPYLAFLGWVNQDRILENSFCEERVLMGEWGSFFSFEDLGSSWWSKECEASFGPSKLSRNYFYHLWNVKCKMKYYISCYMVIAGLLLGLNVRKIWLQLFVCHLVVVWLWAAYLNSLCILICKRI